MKHITQTIILLMGLITGTTLSVFADPQPKTTPAKSNINQLMQGQSHWYEKAATVKPDPKVEAGNGTLLTLQAGSFLYLEGSSTLHKYQMNARTLLGSASLVMDKGRLLDALKGGKAGAMALTVPIKDLKSRESGLDDNAYKALKASDNPNIRFTLKSLALKGDKLTAKGELTIAGVSAPVALSGEAIIKADRVEFKGTKTLKMSDFKIKPPSISLVVTSIDCTDDVTVHFDVIFAPVSK